MKQKTGCMLSIANKMQCNTVFFIAVKALTATKNFMLHLVGYT